MAANAPVIPLDYAEIVIAKQRRLIQIEILLTDKRWAEAIYALAEDSRDNARLSGWLVDKGAIT